MKKIWILTVGGALSFGAINAQEYQGAEKVLQELAAQSGIKVEEKEKPNAAAALLTELKKFRQKAKTLPADQAANTWLAFYDAYAAIPKEALYSEQNPYDRLSFQSLIQALPPSSAWPVLAEKINQRDATKNKLGDGALRVFLAVLNKDAVVRQKAIDELLAGVKGKGGPDEYMREHLEQAIQQVSQLIIANSGTPQEQLAQLEDSIDAFEKKDDKRSGRLSGVAIPDLLKITDKERAEALLLRTFKLKTTITIEGKETQQLAAELALKHMDVLASPLWQLIRDQNDVALFEALDKKFDGQESYDVAHGHAQAVYLLSLIITNRTEDAAKFVTKTIAKAGGDTLSLSSGNLAELQQKGYGKQVLAFLSEMLTRDPSLPLWSDFIKLSAQEGAAGKALTFLKTTIENDKLDAAAKATVEGHYYEALLAADQIDEGVKILRSLIAAGPKEADPKANEEMKKKFQSLGLPNSENLSDHASGQRESIRNYQTLCLKLARIGRLLEKPELVTEGLKHATDSMAKLDSKQVIELGGPNQIIKLLVETGQGPKAEKLLKEYLLQEVKTQQSNRRSYFSTGISSLATLAWIYHEAGRHDDVVKLLDESPSWGAPDLSLLTGASVPTSSLNIIAAQALAKTGKKEQALTIVNELLKSLPGKDDVYELLLELGGDQLIAKLDDCSQADAFEERPLIWKAKLQFDAGQIDEAEKTIRAAIAIDPSDGEQGKGDRMRAYAILGDILEKKGDAETAKVMRGAVTAIRHSEDADDWWEAGLLSRAVAKYEEALLHFADAYCIQSRLALVYSELGQYDKSEEHYRRAYELMPDSFGRVESHCFGCEGAFKGARAQSIAERVFTKLAEEHPNKPQVFYLLGYLRESQSRPLEAAEQYRKAVKLDPDYLNAIKKLLALDEAVKMSNEEKDTLALALFRLDPYSKHSTYSLREMHDLGRLWDTIISAEDKFPEDSATSMYPLAASRDALEKAQPGQDMNYRFSFNRSSRANLLQQFTNHQLIAYTGQLVESLMRQR